MTPHTRTLPGFAAADNPVGEMPAWPVTVGVFTAVPIADPVNVTEPLIVKLTLPRAVALERLPRIIASAAGPKYAAGKYRALKYAWPNMALSSDLA